VSKSKAQKPCNLALRKWNDSSLCCIPLNKKQKLHYLCTFPWYRMSQVVCDNISWLVLHWWLLSAAVVVYSIVFIEKSMLIAFIVT